MPRLRDLRKLLVVAEQNDVLRAARRRDDDREAELPGLVEDQVVELAIRDRAKLPGRTCEDVNALGHARERLPIRLLKEGILRLVALFAVRLVTLEPLAEFPGDFASTAAELVNGRVRLR